MSNKIIVALLAALIGSHALPAAEEILVSSTRSNSIEQFTSTGTWVRTFATTGPYAPISLAQSPLTGEIFATTEWTSGQPAGQLTNLILRYEANGKFDTNWDTFSVACNAPCYSPTTESILFDPSGNLWVATAYGTGAANPIFILEYLAADLSMPNPPAQSNPIMANMMRGDQMAFNPAGDLCIAGFVDEDVQCFNTSTGALTQDYRAEIMASGLGIEPGGLAFDSYGRLYLSSIFTGQVIKEAKKGGPLEVLATVDSAPNLLNANLVLRGSELYVPTYYFPPPTVSTPDAIYTVSTTGTVADFIVGGAPSALGNDHIWGANWLIFFSTTL